MNPAPLDILAVINAPLEMYPPSLNQVSLLAESGARIAVVDCHHPSINQTQFSGPYLVDRVSGSRYTLQYKEALPNRFTRLLRLMGFRNRLQSLIRTRKPRIIIAYDPYAFFLTGILPTAHPRPRLIWHFHELPALYDGVRVPGMAGQAEAFSRDRARDADLLILPDEHRASALADWVGTKANVHVVMNCPRRIPKLPDGRLRQQLTNDGFRCKRIALFQGAVGPTRQPEALLASMSYWPEDSALVFLGPVDADYQRSLLNQANSLSLSRRVHFLSSVRYSDVIPYTVDADVGLSLVDDEVNSNWRFSAGAVNKRFEYMAAGVPQIANRGAGMDELILNPDVGLLADPRSPKSIGEAVTKLLDDDAMRHRLSQCARERHLSTFNYETQFARTLALIADWLPS